MSADKEGTIKFVISSLAYIDVDLKGNNGMYDMSNMLSNLDLFQNLNLRQLHHLSSKLKKKTFISGEFVYRAGEPSDGMYVVYRGCVQTFGVDQAGNRLLFGYYDRGQAFGEKELLDNNIRLTFAQATKPTYLFQLEASDFRDLVSWWPGLAGKLMQESESSNKFDLNLAVRKNGYHTVT